MRSVNKKNNLIEIYDYYDIMSIAKNQNAICFYYNNLDEKNVMHITKEDYDLFEIISELYNNLLLVRDKVGNTCKEIFVDNKIVFHDCYKDSTNLLYIAKVSEDEFTISFRLGKRYTNAVEIICNPDIKKNVYEPYCECFNSFYDNLLNKEFENHQINFDEYEYMLKLKK